MNAFFQSIPARKAFTLIEMLVAIAVMVIALVLLSTIVGGIMNLARVFNHKLDSTEGGRRVIDALESDFSQLAASRGLTVLGDQSNGTEANARLAFLTQSRGASTGSRLTAAGYQRSTNGNLTRFSEDILWTEQNLEERAAETFSAGQATIVGNGILRFSVIAVLDDGRMVPLSDANATNGWKRPVEGVSGLGAFNLRDKSAPRVRALWMGVVVIDEQNWRLLQDTGKLDDAIAAFPAPVLSGGLMENGPDQWASNLASGTDANLSGLPKPALRAIQVFSKTYYLK